MKITQGGLNPIRAYTSQVTGKDKVKQPANSGIQADTFEISSKAKEMRLYREKLAELPVVREDLVADLKQRIQAGSYEPSGDKIAAAIIGERSLDKQVLKGD